ncbi:hypothetical protein RHORCCE3_0030 [Rickettsia hoogstraalii str. RCCE3]|nr:hypothetical protein RHORCCE3_0030 [Rickettsia hoogstraalii str. RCCE3]
MFFLCLVFSSLRRKIENFDEAISGYLMRLPRSLWAARNDDLMPCSNDIQHPPLSASIFSVILS